MDRATVDVYEAGIDAYLARDLRTSAGAADFAAAVPAGALRLDLGSGPGHMTAALGEPVVAVDAAWQMVSRVTATPLRVQADLEALPLRQGALAGTWASKCLQHVDGERVPLVLGDLHRSMRPGARLDVVVFEGDGAARTDAADDLPGRLFWHWSIQRLLDVAAGAGFTDLRASRPPEHLEDGLHLTGVRGRTLPDTVGPGMRVLVCGLNPSLLSADLGVGFARPGNRFWPAAIAAGLAERPLDPLHALRHHGLGMTNLVTRASVGAAELTSAEYREGAARVERLCRWLRPGAVCFVGLAGYRAAVDRKAAAGVQPEPFGGVAAYLMPNTSGLNAHTKPAGFADHLRAAAALADDR